MSKNAASRKSPPKQRNPFVQHLIQKNGGGVHVKSFKAFRAQKKAELRKNLGETHEDR